MNGYSDFDRQMMAAQGVGGMDDNGYFDYLIAMGMMRPEQVEQLRRQKQIDALREQSMTAPSGQMIGKHYVAPSLTQNIAQLGKGYIAGKMQEKQNKDFSGMLGRQKETLEEMRRKRRGGGYLGDGGAGYIPSVDEYGASNY